MKQTIFFCILCLSIFVFACSTSAPQNTADEPSVKRKEAPATMSSGAQPLQFGIVPSSNVDNILEHYNPLKKYLQTELDRKIRFNFTDDYQEVIEGLGFDIDFSILGAYSFVKASILSKAIPIVRAVRFGKASYNSVIVVRKDSGLKSIADLKGKKIVFTDRYSTSGFLYPMAAILRAGLDPQEDITYSFVKGHDNSVKHVYLGQADAGACFEGAEQQFLKGKQKNEVTVLAVVGEVPSDPIVISHELSRDKALVERLKSALLKLNLQQHKRILKALSGKVEKYVATSDEDYNLLRENIMLVEKALKLK